MRALAGRRRVLLAGAGGGYDVMGAVPLAVALRAAGFEVAFASLSFAYLNGLAHAEPHPRFANLYRVTAAAATERAYCPEAWLARILDEQLGAPPDSIEVWCFDKTGARPLAAAYRYLIERLAIDAVVLIDGGIDAILRGDESSLGTPAEDLASLSAVTSLEGVARFVACVGMGAELRDRICHEQVFARIAELTRQGGYYGTSALVRGDEATEQYLAAVDYVFRHQADQRRSHIHKCIVEAIAGDYGEVAPDVWLSPLMPLVWCSSFDVIAQTHLFLGNLAHTETIWEISAHVEGARKSLAVRPRSTIPI